MILVIPFEFNERVKAVSGEKGEAWLLKMPDLLQTYIAKWDLQSIQPVSKLSYNFVVKAKDSKGNGVFLKMGIPGSELNSEIAALNSFHGTGCVRLLQSCITDGVILVEDARPGTSVQELTLSGKDEEAVVIASQIIARLQTCSYTDIDRSHKFQTVEDWAGGFQRLRGRFSKDTGPFDFRLVDRAENEYLKLLATTEKQRLLHGDLHHGNILSATREPWLAIDPKGILGDPAYEVGAFIRNPMPELITLPNVESILRRRIDLFSEKLGFDRKRVWSWSFSQTVLSAWWLFEDHQNGYESWLKLAELLLELE